MELGRLLDGIEVLAAAAEPGLEIRGVQYDSRNIAPGELFVAISGYQTDGHRFIEKAKQAGAAAVVCERVPETEIPYILVPSSRAALAQLGANWFGRPAEKMVMLGVTGTNGKTTSTYRLKHILEKTRGARVGLIGTIQNMIGDEVLPTERTTPESFELQRLFAQMLEAGCTHVVMEVSSHALALHRADAIFFRVGAFSNLTEDHLDFHRTMEEYCRAKALLFTRCETGCVNADDPYAAQITQNASCRVLRYAVEDDRAELTAKNVRLRPDRVEFEAVTGGESCRMELGIPGLFSVYNALCVTQMALALGVGLQEIAASLKTARGVKGRAEVVPTPGKDYTVLIDYSHTPDSLEKILKTVRGFCKGRILAVFGCGGDRDPIKRPIMGRIGAQLSDLCIITSDNPRTEDPNAIIAQIAGGAREIPGAKIKILENRPAAIAWAMAQAGKDDVIVLCGKGHETYQEVGHEKLHMDEREIVASVLENEV